MCDLVSTVASNNNNQTNCLNQKSIKLLADYKQIILELRAQNFDVIRFATYRTASKLRFIQKKLNLHLIDLWNVIETFRDNNLHQLDQLYELDLSKLEQCVLNMYLELNKRLALNQQINVDQQTQLLLAWLLNLFDKNKLSKIKVFSFKIALTIMCTGKLIDKLKYIFNQISEQSKQTLVAHKFELFLKEVLILPKSVFEEPSFGYNENLSRTCFDLNSQIYLDDFLSVALSDVGPPCFIWLNIFHRFIVVQNVIHPVKCNVCDRSNFNGFRYKCQKCRKYQLCQDCFWRGRISNSHQLNHQMKEYTSYKSAAKQLSNSLKRSFFCKPNKSLSKTQLQKLPTSPKLNTQTSSNRHISSSYNNTSDYNLLYKNSNQKENLITNSKLQTQTLNDLNSQNSISYSLPATTSLPINSDFCLSNNLKQAQKEPVELDLDLNKIQLQQIDLKPQPNSSHYQSLQRQSNFSNTLSMTKPNNNNNNNNNDNLNYASTNILTNLMQSKTNQTSSSNICNNNNNPYENDEHNIISSYCSRLSEYYKKNPHLLNEKNFPSKLSKIKTNLNKEYQIPRTSSLSRPIYSSSTITNRNNTIKAYNQNTLANLNSTKNVLLQNDLNKKLNNYAIRSLSETNFNNTRSNSDSDSSNIDERLLQEKKELVAKLEKQNREIIKEIKRLRLKQMSNCSLDLTDLNHQQSNYYLNSNNNQNNFKLSSFNNTPMSATLSRKTYDNDNYYKQNYLTNNQKQKSTQITPDLLAELQTLKHRKGQLENRMQMLENSRDELINRLSQLDAMIGAQNSKKNQYQYTSASPSKFVNIVPNISASTAMQIPNLSQKSPHTHRNGIITSVSQTVQPRSWSTPSTPAIYEFHPSRNRISTNTSLAPSNSSLYSTQSNNLRNDLLIAADSVTNAMQNLVKELNSENESFSSGDEDENENENDFNYKPGNRLINFNSITNTPVINNVNRKLVNEEFEINNNNHEDLDEEADEYSENDVNLLLYENYLLNNESFIDDLNQQNQNSNNKSDQVSLWRKELEQILIQESSNVNNEHTFNQQQALDQKQ